VNEEDLSEALRTSAENTETTAAQIDRQRARVDYYAAMGWSVAEAQRHLDILVGLHKLYQTRRHRLTERLFLLKLKQSRAH